MPTGGHLFVSQLSGTGPASEQVGMHWEEGIGWGPFPVAWDNPGSCVGNPTFGCYPSYFDPHNQSLDDLWFGGVHSGAAFYEFPVFHWDGVFWTKYTLFDASMSFTGGTTVSRAPGTNIVYAACNANNGGQNSLWRFNGTAWSIIRLAGNFGASGGGEKFIPLAVDGSTCVWCSTEVYAAKAAYWLDENTQYTGGDLPITGFRGLSQLGDGTVFLLTSGGDVYRSASINGPFTLDNPTLGPFVGDFNSFSSDCYMNSSADGNVIVIQGRNTDKYWVRDGPDNWTEYAHGLGGTVYGGMPSAVNRQVLLRGSSGASSLVSYDGGTAWSAPRGNESAKGPSTGAMISDISTGKRILATNLASAFGVKNLWWRGNALHSPWAHWSEVRADPQSFANFDQTWGVQGFDTGHAVLSGRARFGGEHNFANYDPDLDTWTPYGYFVEANSSVFGTAYEAGKIHGVTNWRYNAELQYSRWNGSGYDNSAIPGSSKAGTFGDVTYYISADDTGQDVWVPADLNGQLWHSSNGGSTWTNRHAAAAAVHADADQAKDAFVVSATEVYVAFNTAGGETRFSLWNGSVWSIAAPNLTEGSSRRCLHVDGAGDLWFWESGASAAKTYKLVTGSWVLQDTYNDGRTVYGIGGNDDDSLMAAAVADVSTTYGSITTNADSDLLGWWPLRNEAIDAYTDVSPFGLDTEAPYLANLSPYSGEVGVDPNGNIVLEILDDGDGVDAATVVIKVNSVTAWTGDVQQAGFSVTKAVVSGGFRYTIDPDDILPPGTTIVEVYAEDLA